jgi:predicted dehydrogenase
MTPLRLGLLSTAKINTAIIDGAAATDRVEVVAVASRAHEPAVAYAREHGIERAHGSYEALLTDDMVDAVYISLPNGMHHAWTMRALAAGKHVLCEKPYTRRPDEVEEAWDLAGARGLVLMEAFMYRHHPQTVVVRELVAGGAVGRLRLVRASFSFFLGDPTNVRALPELDGGALMDIGCYCVSGSRLLAGEPTRVLGEQVISPTGVDLTFTGILRFPDEVVAQIDASFAAPGRQLLEAIGEEGVVRVAAPWRTDWGGTVVVERDGQEESIPVPAAGAYTLQLENLADAVAGRAPQLLGRDDALAQARVIQALYRSATEGRAVDL